MPLASARFAEYAAQDAQNHGMNLRFSFPPYPLVGRPREVLRKYVEGNDPISGNPLMPQIIDALTKPLTEEEKNPKSARRKARPRLLQPDTEENLHRLFLENGWTDGAPDRPAHRRARGAHADGNRSGSE